VLSPGAPRGNGGGFGQHAAEAAAVPPANTTFLETFDGAPSSPQPFQADGWDVTVHSRDVETFYQLPPVLAHHGSNCASPGDNAAVTHGPVTAYADAVFRCADHVMTALNGGNYGMIYLTPNQLLDFSGGEGVVRFDMSTFVSSQRDWMDVWVTPFEDNLQGPLEDWIPDGQGVPRRAVHIRMNRGGTNAELTIFTGEVMREFQTQNLPSDGWKGFEQVLSPSAARRDTFELHVSRTRIKFGMPAYNLWWIDTQVADLGWSAGVVQFGHHSYNPTKCSPCSPDTWHWDNVSISPAVPFTMIGADRRYVDGNGLAEVRFDRPAPAGARLRFMAMSGPKPDISFDGGATWETAEEQPSSRPVADHFRMYFTPAPAGATSVRLRAAGGYWGGSWLARDFSIWSPGGGGNTQGALIPTAPPTATSPPTPAATATPAAAATRTPAAQPTTPAATATRTPAAQPPTQGADFGVQLSAGDSNVDPGAGVTLSAAVTSSRAANVLIDLEVRGPSGDLVFQRFFDNQSIGAGQTRQYNATWPVAANAERGYYTFRAGVFSPGWGTLYEWVNDGPRIFVRTNGSPGQGQSPSSAGAPPTSAPPPAPTATRAPAATTRPPSPTATRRPSATATTAPTSTTAPTPTSRRGRRGNNG
jgi:hypothetical protein